MDNTYFVEVDEYDLFNSSNDYSNDSFHDSLDELKTQFFNNDSFNDSFNETHNDIIIKPKRHKQQFNVDDEMHKAFNKFKSSINNEKQRKISDNIYAYYNSLNIICGKPGSGKSFLTCRDIIQLSRIPSIHCIKYISKTGKCDDETFKSIIHLIKCPIDYLSEDNAEQHLRTNKEFKDEYKSYKRNPRPTMEQSSRARSALNPKVMKFLHVNDLNNDVLNTVLLFEDFVGSKLIHNKFINWMFSELRHNNSIVYINIQFFKSITTDIKNNATAFFIYPGYSREQMQYMKRQISIPFNEEFNDFNDLYDRYSKMKNNEVLMINLKSNEIKFIKTLIK